MSETSDHRELSVPPEKMKEALQHCVDVYNFIAYVVRQRAGSFMDERDKDFLRELMEELNDISDQMDEVEDDISCHLMWPITLIQDESEIIYPAELIAIDYIENIKRVHKKEI